ncbi:MAG: hypothetical protein IKZ81_03480, partial [Clostridia bacterium]|nr:hypothetical protein [Clostridia bacterium]
MINKSWKKLLSVLLSVAMLLSLMPGIGLIASASTVSFTKVTDANDVTAGNIGECTTDDAKAWVLANWDTVTSTTNQYIDIVYYVGTALNYFSLKSTDTKDSFENTQINASTGPLDLIKSYVTDNDDVYLCVPAAAPAVTTYPLWVGETQVTSANATDTAAHPTWSYDADTNTLSLDGFTYNGPGYQYLKDDFDDIRAGIYYSDSAKALTIEFSDNNAVSASNSGVPVSGIGNTAAGIRSEGDLILCAPNGGTLDINATGTQAVGIWAPNVTVNSGAPTITVNATDGARSFGVNVDNTFTVNGEAEVQVNDTTTNLTMGWPIGILAIHAVFNGGWTYVSMNDSKAVGINCNNKKHFDPMTGEDVIDEYGSLEMNGGYLSSTSPEVAINVNNDTGFKLAAGTTMKYGDLVTIATYTGDLADAYDAIREIEDINGQIVQNAAKYVTLSVPAHTHSFTYSASGAVVTAACAAGCPAGYDDANKPALTIVAPALTAYG